MRRFSLLVGLCMAGGFAPMSAQVATYPTDSLVVWAIRQQPLSRAAATRVQQSRALERTAWDIPALEFNLESPTGDFYALGFIQNFELPTSYIARRKALVAQTAFAQAQANTQQRQLAQEVRLLALHAQHARALEQELERQDSLWRVWEASAQRQREAGELEALDQLWLQQRASTTRQQLAAQRGLRAGYIKVLAAFAGRADSFALEPLQPRAARLGDLGESPILREAQQNQVVQEAALRAQRQSLMPAFYVGFLNQGPRNTPIGLQFRAGLSVPLWYGAPKARIEAAQLETQIARHQTDATRLALERKRLELETRLAASREQLQLFETDLLPKTELLLQTAERLRAAGELKYQLYINALAEAFQTRTGYWDAVLEHNALALALEGL